MKDQQNQASPANSLAETASFGRRLGAIFYDLLLVTAIVLFAAIPFVLITGDTSKNFFIRLAFQLYLIAAIFFYYAGFWTHGGQTLGLLTWKLRLVTHDGMRVTWIHALKRFTAAAFSLACFGLGFLWAILDRKKLTWHDRLSGTRIVRTTTAPPS